MSEVNEQKPETQSQAETLYDNTPTETVKAEGQQAPSNPDPQSTEKPAEVKASEDGTPAEEPTGDKSQPEGQKAEKKEGEEEKPKEEDKPEEYELTAPENSLVPKEWFDKTVQEAKEKGLTKEQAEALVNRDQSFMADLVTSHQAKIEEWKTTAASDKEIGGTNLNKNIELARQVVEKYGTPDLKNQLEVSGYGNHPELIRLLVRIGNAYSPDTFVQPRTAVTEEKKSVADILYNN